ncbi:hypothetical protein C1Y40_00023 [Mycobacterium talmoniae]|uniref:Uncharacterized protein n=1 Tax=Mycobacterium talmoniae TaxID=1858794 RepID=A0A2S8BSV5_9MYCO|nr:hypothetical protein C1Y40_00023 [Mycobacterium talmoniae]
MHTEGNNVLVGRQKTIAFQGSDPVCGFAPQHGFEFLRDNGTAEYPSKCVADRGFEFALDALNQPPLAAHLTARLTTPFWVVACR